VLVRELHRRRELDLEATLLLRDEALELAEDLADLGGAVLLRDEQDEVAHELVGAFENALERGAPLGAVELGVREQGLELRHGLDRRDEVAEVFTHAVEAVPLERGLEARVRVDAMR